MSNWDKSTYATSCEQISSETAEINRLRVDQQNRSVRLLRQFKSDLAIIAIDFEPIRCSFGCTSQHWKNGKDHKRKSCTEAETFQIQ